MKVHWQIGSNRLAKIQKVVKQNFAGFVWLFRDVKIPEITWPTKLKSQGLMTLLQSCQWLKVKCSLTVFKNELNSRFNNWREARWRKKFYTLIFYSLLFEMTKFFFFVQKKSFSLAWNIKFLLNKRRSFKYRAIQEVVGIKKYEDLKDQLELYNQDANTERRKISKNHKKKNWTLVK